VRVTQLSSRALTTLVVLAVILVAAGCGNDKKTNPEPTGTWEVVGTEGISSGEADFISLCLDGDTPYVAFTDEAVDNVVVKRFDGSAWVQVGDDVSSGPGAYLGALTVSGGVPFVAYGATTAVVKKYEGGQWTDVGGPASIDHAAELKMFISGGIPYVAYRDADHNYKITVRKFVDPDWVTVGTANFSDGPVDLISLAVDGSTPYVAFRDYAHEYHTTVMKYDGAWTVLGTPGVLPGEPGRWAIAVEAGVPYVVYSNQSEGSVGQVNVVKFAGGTATLHDLPGPVHVAPGLRRHALSGLQGHDDHAGDRNALGAERIADRGRRERLYQSGRAQLRSARTDGCESA
jgi:hypothetical protein